MAITKSSVEDTRVRIKAGLLFGIAGAIAGAAAGWQTETARIGSPLREQGPAYVIGYSAVSAGLSGYPAWVLDRQIRTYQDISRDYPLSAAAFKSAAKKSFVWPWPVIGFFCGLSLMLLLSRLNERLTKS